MPFMRSRATARHQGSTALEQPPMGLRYVMTASADMPGSLNQLRRAELTATCRLAVSPYLWRSSRVTPIRCSARIPDPVAWEIVDRQASHTDLCVPERAATAFNAHRLSRAPAA